MSNVRNVLLGLGAILTLSFGAGAVSGVMRQRSSGHAWSQDGIRGAKAGCMKLGGAADVCDCYAATLSQSVEWSEFLHLSEAAAKGWEVAPEKVERLRAIATACGVPH